MKKNFLALLLVVTLVISLFVGCSNSKTSDRNDSKTTKTSEEEFNQTKDKEEGKSSYKIGFANIGESVELQIEVKKSVERAAKAAGVELVYMNNDMDGATAVQNADNMIQKKIDGLIEFNIDESVGPTIKEKMDEAGIPIISVDIPIEDTVFFGANNITAGIVGGKRLADVAKERWNEEPEILLLVIDSTSGETPLERVRQMPEGIREVFPEFSNDKVFEIDGGADAATAQKVVSDFLSAHPNEDKIAVGCFHDVIATSTLAAIETAGREDDCIMVSENEYGYLDYLVANPEPIENETWVGGVAFFFTRYGDYLVPAMIDILEGKQVEDNIYVEHEAITRDNAQEYFSEYLSQ